MKLEVDGKRLMAEIEELAEISDAPAPAVTRIVFTPTDLKARAWLRARCEEAGLSVRQDPIGNTFVRWAGREPTAPAVGTGSHVDAIPNAGKYDGVVGVLVDVGRGRRRPSDVVAMLRAGDRSRATTVAPPHGLCLVSVDY